MTLDTSLSSGQSGHRTAHETLHTFYNGSLADLVVRFVSKNGSDSNDGLTWGSAFLTIKAAVADLPSVGSGGSARQTGSVFIGGGVFAEDNPLEINRDLRYIGVGSAAGSEGGTEIQGSNDAHLFAPTGVFTDVAGFVVFKDLRLDGTSMGAGDFDLLRIDSGGFGTRIDNVFFRGASRHGLYLIDSALTVLVVNCQWANLEGDCIYFFLNGAIPVLHILQSQADEVAGYFLNVEHITSAEGAMIKVDGLKMESATAGDQDRVINFKPRTSSGGNPVFFDISNITVAINDAGGASTIINEEDQTGVPAHWTIHNISEAGSGSYTDGFNSAETGQKSFATSIRNAIFGIADFTFKTPSLEIGVAGVDSGTGTPESNLARPVGFLYLRTDGGTGTTLYIKESGTGNTGWAAK